MKTEEDEAFDDIARRQGGGGFQAKKAMAKARIEEDDDIQVYKKPWVGLTKEDMPNGLDPMFDHEYFIAGMVFASKVLEKKNT